MTKTTITERINSINFDTLTENDFNFLVDRALKSVRKASGDRKPTKNQTANEGLKADLLNVLSARGCTMKATEVGKEIGISVQKASALLKQLVDAGEIVRVKEGKSTFFGVPKAE